MSYIQNTDRDRQEMLDAIGVSSIDELLAPVAPELRVDGSLDLPSGMSEAEISSAVGATNSAASLGVAARTSAAKVGLGARMLVSGLSAPGPRP